MKINMPRTEGWLIGMGRLDRLANNNFGKSNVAPMRSLSVIYTAVPNGEDPHADLFSVVIVDC